MRVIDIRAIKVGGEIGRRIDTTIQCNLLLVDLKKDFLNPFKEKWNGERLLDFIGLGKYFDALTRFAAYKQEKALTALRQEILDTIISLQEEDGYIGIMPVDKRFNTLWDIHEICFIIIGLVNDYAYWNETRSLEMAKKLANYLMKRWETEPNAVPNWLYFSTLGVEEAFILLYSQTKEQKYLDFVAEFLKLQEWEGKIVIGRHEKIDGHIYNFLSKTLAKLMLNKFVSGFSLDSTALSAVDFMINKDGMVITGEVGNNECWMDNQESNCDLGETCATVYAIKLFHHLLLQSGNSIYGDLIERVIYNGLFAAQSPDGRQIRYYTNMEGSRSYFHLDTYCCPNNYRRGISDLPEMVYYISENAITLNLYTSSTANIKLDEKAAVTIRQDTNYPEDGKVKINISTNNPVEFVIRLRIPSWCCEGSIEINGEKTALGQYKGKFFEVKRLWGENDNLILNFFMPFRFIKGRKMQHGRVAIMRGPVVFCLSGADALDIENVTSDTITIIPTSLEGPFSNTEIAGELHCNLSGWYSESNYPLIPPPLKITLSRFIDPNGKTVYFRAPNPYDRIFEDDELLSGQKLW